VSRLRVGLNLLFLKPAKVGGTEEYVGRIIRSLETEAVDDVELTLFVNRRFRIAHPALAAGHPTVVAPISGDSPPIRIAAESSWLARQTARRPLDLVHHPANTIPQFRTRPAVVTIHDLQPIVRPQDFGRIKGAYLRTRLRPAARESRMVTTPSEYVRRLAIDHFDLDEGRVVVVPAPILSRRAADGDGPPRALGIERPFFLYAAITHPHKNHITLIRAFARVAAIHPAVSMVLTGGPGRGEQAVLDEIGRLALNDRVRRTGWIARGDLDALLRYAAGLTFPSRHEGYGIPLAEAMALDCPVIASNATALPEVLGDAGLLVDPDDIDGWAEAMLRLLEDGALRKTLVAAGRKQVRALSPGETARRLVATYRMTT